MADMIKMTIVESSPNVQLVRDHLADVCSGLNCSRHFLFTGQLFQHASTKYFNTKQCKAIVVTETDTVTDLGQLWR